MQERSLEMRDQATETHLVERLRQGDDSALGELSAAYGSKIFQLAFRYVKNREDAEEVTQDVLMKVYRKIDAFRGDAALSSWIYRITFNTAMSRLRHTRSARMAALTTKRSGVDDDGRAATTRPTYRPLPTRMLGQQTRERCQLDAAVDLPHAGHPARSGASAPRRAGG
jgi:RNA polymerase sigma factor (sigma-70 family)